jgi:hypothetical protein
VLLENDHEPSHEISTRTVVDELKLRCHRSTANVTGRKTKSPAGRQHAGDASGPVELRR